MRRGRVLVPSDRGAAAAGSSPPPRGSWPTAGPARIWRVSSRRRRASPASRTARACAKTWPALVYQRARHRRCTSWGPTGRM